MSNLSIDVGNWSQYVKDAVKGKTSTNYTISGPDPAYGCSKEFTANYRCSNIAKEKTINIPGEAGGQTALFDCTSENNNCKGLRLTLGDDGNLILTNSENKQIWTSNTNKTGLALDEYSAKNGKYGRNYLLAGETLYLGEFIGSPSGNCYFMMDRTPDGNGLQLKYSVLNCNDSQYGDDETTNGLFSLVNSAYKELISGEKTVKPNIDKLNKMMSVQDKLFSDKASQLKTDTHNYMGIRDTKTVVNKNIGQLDAMEEDRLLFLTRYKYRRVVWSILAVFVILGGIKVVRNNT
jgi:hypothetical protein